MRNFVAGTVFLLLSVSAKISHAQDVEYTTRFPTNEINSSSPAANTAKSFAAAARMGHLAWVGTTPPDENSLIHNCAMMTGTSPWPGSCNPAGMVQALTANGSGSWVASTYLSTQVQNAVDAQVSYLTSSLKSPNVVPLYGHADHWGINHSIWKNNLGAVVEFDFYDGGPAGSKDGTNSGYLNGLMMVDPDTWKNIFYRIITTVPATDPYYNKFVNLYEPPWGTEPPVSPSEYRRSPSPLDRGTRVTPPLVRDLALKSLHDAGFARHQKEWSLLAASTPT